MTVDPDLRAILIVAVVGSAIFGIGAVTLFFAFRAFGEKKAGGSSHLGLILGLITFIFACCAALFALSYANR